MLNKEIPKGKLERIKLVVLDSDGVIVPRGTTITENEDANRYYVKVETHKITQNLADKINKLREKIKVCVSSGRGLIYLQSMYSRIVGDSTIFQAENGNLSLIGGKIVQHFNYSEDYFKKIASIRNEVMAIKNRNSSILGFEPKQFILTIFASEEVKQIYEIVKKYDEEKELKVMWNGEAFDIQKKDISKGEGLKRLLKNLHIKKEEVIAIGDRLNDKELLETAGIGVSADKDELPMEYWTVGKGFPGEILVDYLLKEL